ncbi:HEAT repeat protein [Rubripirellula lacrimiformis]|uniref:HEAT repeat protein n=1 Tax=Rubripirellula lacrimiformis TaxID=1930273 RepID=A0A517NHK0_9BACT|nr:PVC-type heme-binding CxxCH protein [Rubripirellula lacrimiformis]QDT06617.1 HEAT repeat protein [Rubripirellula lacrimiformis]
MNQRFLGRLLAASCWLSGCIAVGFCWADDFGDAPLGAASIQVPAGFTVELAAGPPLVTHPTMACFDDAGCLYVCNNAGVNATAEQLEDQLPNSIRKLVDRDGDGRFDASTVFADKMTFPMGGVWHDGSLYVASPPNIWRLTDTDGDGVADERKVLVSKFGYNGNAASVHGCFFGPDGRLYWTDGFHGHEFRDEAGNVTSQRQGSYLFSCLPDGSDKQIHCGGGMDNPVEIDFTDSGDLLGSVNIIRSRPRVDALVHWLHGGAYPHRRQVLEEMKITGDVLEPTHGFGHVAVSGMTRYRSGALDDGWRDNLFATFFNGGKVVRLDLQPSGSTYTATQHEFLSSTSRDFHPTDVLEDADGSLLVIDTGGWFYRGCPTSQFAKPDVLGGIYRIRKTSAPELVSDLDPRGLQIDWAMLSPSQLIQRMGDPRFAVRQRAISESAARGQRMLPSLGRSIADDDATVRRNSVWTLTRLAVDDAAVSDVATTIAVALDDVDPTIRQAACMGLSRCGPHVNVDALILRLSDESMGVRRRAAATLGMVGAVDAVPALIRSLQSDTIDRSAEHAMIYALIEIGDSPAIRQAWDAVEQDDLLDRESKEYASVQRGVWIALDQISPDELTFSQIASGLTSNDPPTRRFAVQTAIGHPAWLPRIVQWMRDLMKVDDGNGWSDSIEKLMSAFIADPAVAELASMGLQGSAPEQTQLMVLRAIADGNHSGLHPGWIDSIKRRLSDHNDRIVHPTIAAVASMSGDTFDQPLAQIYDDQTRSISLRISAMAARAAGGAGMSSSMLDRLLAWYRLGPPSVSNQVIQIIGTTKIAADQLPRVIELLPDASPAQLRQLLPLFASPVDADAARSFLDAMDSADALLSLAVHEFSDVILRFPPDTLDQANRILDRLKQHQQQKLDRLASIRQHLSQGDSARGRMVFHSEKSKCSACHRIGQQGNRVGPDLTTIGANRSASDLLESIVFPSASIVRDYTTHKVLTVDGRAFVGVVVEDAGGAIQLQQANGKMESIAADDIDQIAASAVSIMPAGLDEALTEAELVDIVTFLLDQR